MSKKDLYELIEAYINGSLDPEEMQSVSDRIAEDQEFAKEVRLHQELSETFGDSGVDDLSQVIRKVVDEEKDESLFKRNKWIIFIGVMLLVVAGLWIGKSILSEPSPQDLYRQFADFPTSQEYLGTNLIRSESDVEMNQVDSLWGIFYRYYNQGNWDSATEVLMEIEEIDPTSNQLQLQYGLVQVKQGNYNDAIEYFEIAKEVQDMAFWYLGLSYLKLNDIENAKNNLLEISSKIHPRSDQAQELLQEIDN